MVHGPWGAGHPVTVVAGVGWVVGSVGMVVVMVVTAEEKDKKKKKKNVKSTDSHQLSLLSQCTVHNQVDMLRKIDFLRNCLCGMNTGISNCVSAHTSFCFLTQHCIHADVLRNKYYMKTQVYLVGGEGGSWSGGARLKALPSNICICVRTSSMDG